MQPPPVVTPPTVTAPHGVPTTTPAAAPQAAIQPLPSSAPPQASVATNSSASENSAASGGGAPSAPKPASGFASLSDVPSATGTAPAETTDQALIPPQTVPVKKPRPHAAYASNKYQPTPGLGTVLRRSVQPAPRNVILSEPLIAHAGAIHARLSAIAASTWTLSTWTLSAWCARRGCRPPAGRGERGEIDFGTLTNCNRPPRLAGG